MRWSRRSGATLAVMDVGEPQRIYTVEPLEDPVPREVPVPDGPAEEPDEQPAAPEKVPA
jgi:hypothetical protein